MKFTKIGIDEIDLADERFRISHQDPSEELTASIQAAGVINPPVLTRREGRVIVVCGWKRILVCKKLGLSPLPVFISPETDDRELFKNPVYENVSFRNLSAFEKAEILSKLRNFGEADEDLIRRYLTLLKVPATRRYLELYWELAQLEPEVKLALERQETALAVLELLIRYSPEERTLLLPVLLTLGKNKQKELMTLLIELAQRENVSPKDILTGLIYQTILQDDKLSPIQKADRILVTVREQRRPELTQWSRAFETALRALDLEKGVVISPVPFFEGEELNLTFGFRSREEFLEKISELTRLAAKPEFSGLFQPRADNE